MSMRAVIEGIEKEMLERTINREERQENEMSDRIQTGTEHGVEWKIDSLKFDPIVITVKSLSNGEEETKVYNCQHRPLFGYDVEDNANVEKILDELIIKYADDGYGKDGK